MTTKELYLNITEGTIVTAEMAEKAQSELAKMAVEATKRAEKAAAKRSSEDAPLVEAMQTLLSDHKVRTASEMAEALGISTSKATAVAKRIPNLSVSEVQVNRRIVKGYSL